MLQKIEIKPYLSLGMRRKWWVVIPFIFTILAGTIYLYLCPKSYKATTLVMLEPQRIPESFVRSTLTDAIESRLSTISQQVSSRTNIERIAKDFHLSDKGPEDRLTKIVRIVGEKIPFMRDQFSAWQQATLEEQVSFQNLIERIRKNIDVRTRIGPSGREQASFEISFLWNNQDIVAPVTNAIVAKFIEDNLSAREEVATSTTDFLDSESSAIRGELETREKDLEAFRKKNMGMLPDQLQSNISILAQLREQSRALEARIEQERQQAMLVRSQEQIARAERQATAAALAARNERSAPGHTHEGQLTFSQLTSGSLEDLEAELARMRAMYTEKHPDVIALERRVEELKQQGYGSPSRPAGALPNFSRDRAELQVGVMNSNVESYKKQIQTVQEQIELYKQRVERAPQIEMELNKVLRGYETVRQRYDNLLSRKLDSKMAEELERRKKGAQFRVLDPAVRPPSPFSPNPVRVLLISLVAGLGLGFGLAYVREMVDPAFYSPEDLEAYLKTEVIVSLPTVAAKAHFEQ